MFAMSDENWRKDNKTVTSRLKVVLRQEKFSDVTFVVQGKEFRCHRLILALGSPYFERTFYHTFRNADHVPITLHDISPEAFQLVLNFLYSDKVTFGNEKQAFQTYEAAEKFRMDDLKSECEIYLSEIEFRPTSVWQNLNLSTALKMEKMQRRYMTYIQNNTHECLQDVSFLMASESTMLAILKSETLNIAEIELLYRLVEWIKHRNPYSLKEAYLKPFINYIRFRAMTPKEFCSFLQSHPNLIDSQDSLQILQHLELPHKNSLPTWCSRFPRRLKPYN